MTAPKGRGKGGRFSTAFAPGDSLPCFRVCDPGRLGIGSLGGRQRLPGPPVGFPSPANGGS